MTACLRDYRCAHCRKLLFKGLLVEGSVEMKCRHCRALTVVSASRFNELLCLIEKCPNRIACADRR